jgi:hypothetical protein
MAYKHRAWPHALLVSTLMLGILACSAAHGGKVDPAQGCAMNAPAPTTGDATAGVPPSATCSTSGRVICNRGLASSIPAGGPVVAVAGMGTPPVPAGGAVSPGDYQLVSVTVWGEPPPNTVGWPRPGDITVAMLHVSCDTYNMVYNGPNSTPDSGLARQIGFGNTCGRLVPQAIPLVALAGYDNAVDPWGDLTPYSATSQTLTLIQLEPYRDYGFDLVEGSLTIVQELALVGSSAPVVTATGGPACGPPPTSTAPRDPRCPASPPAATQPCNPSPTPLECEYGGDVHGRCTTLLICALLPDGTFHFTSPPGSGSSNSSRPCGTNPPGCPSTYASAMADDVGADAGLCSGTAALLCDYAEGVCGCGNGSSASGWTCAPRAPAGGACPSTERPLAGDRCTNEGQLCDYGSPCVSGTWAGPPMLCENGYWEVVSGLANCPAIGP